MGAADLDVLKQAYEAFGRGDVPGVLSAFTDDIEWYEAEGLPYGGLYRGPQEVAEKVFGPVVMDIPDFSVTPEEYISNGEQVAVVARYAGTGQQSGERLDLQVVHVWDFRDGKLSRFRQFIDTVKFREVVPESAAVA